MIGVLALQGQEQHGVGEIAGHAHGHCDGQVLLVVHDGHTIAGIRAISACGLSGIWRVPATISANSL